MSQFQSKKIIYRSGSTELEGVLVFDASLTAPAAGLVMAPNWMGVTEASVSLAEKAAARGYVVLIADLYGKGVRPGSAEEAGTVMMSVKNTDEEVGRMAAAMQALTSQTDAPVTADKVAVFGFCFGGHCALELARSGASLKAAISFHGGLDTCGSYDAKNIKGSVLVLDGAGDPLVPREQLPAFAQEMTTASVDWKLHSYKGAVHSFTDVQANVKGVAEYNADVSARAFAAMFGLLDEVF
ncbi:MULTISPECIES: dienelactone hydrolase family protein [Tatumella]|uniref:Dienelactone hydrolase family protein n=1 Tax=Tatumella punctata TaxID=399969 RepID=A0ABW1VME2_9GAMM|nr:MULTISPECIES: dienelactone hydrolase family protein [unclassified Tatumella]MBS0857597.1 dienelactone hydrolase family protein [Tatumella sp. JGM16]MBS0876546.1 dienelactone hydrolase family protein [Tatumella sp. JGM82]MBS0890067.1 dienelactone hydrolase family protein [Tatumella sp. JGM94]MBS0895044.1 dienelactone hydrolase family protein [Tatumella sp. JGM130]MBS0901311.1 dienelactone hydrolase family protein [Tatumella sp. JGM100]